LTYFETTERMPPTTARRDILGPFARFVADCLLLARAPVTDNDPDRTGLAVQLINDLDRLRRKGKLVRDFRRILGPLREADTTVSISALGRLIEDGKAEAVRVQPDDDTPFRKSALIEFPDVGRLCFFVAPGHWWTVGVKPYPRTRIMALAANLYAINAPERGARTRMRRNRSLRAIGKPAVIARAPKVHPHRAEVP
jgi:hypothetical protein